MVTRLTNYTKQFWILLSTDDMDTLGAHNGDEAIVIDQDKRYVFDEDHQTWHQIPMSGGGSDNRFVVTLTPTNPDYSGTMDKTVSEINEAWNAGKFIYFDFLGNITPLSTRSGEGAFYVHLVASMNGTDVFVVANTTDMDTDPNSRGYSVKVYRLTPMGS